MLNYEEIPLEFRNINLNDDKTVELQLDKFAKWLTALSEKTGHPLTFERKDLKLLIWHLRSREVFEKSNDFVIAHEMSHLIEGNMPDQNLILKGAKITGIALTVLSLVLIPFVNIGIATALIITALTITILATLILRKQMEHARQCEKNCDISAAKVLKDIDGGMHTFESERLYTLSLRNLLPSCLKWFLNEQGNNTYDDTHPLLTERIDYLKKWKEDNLGANNLQDKPFHNYLREKVHALPIERQNRLYFRIWDFAGKPQTHDLQWGEHHAYNNWDRLAAALRQA
ncbi:MAG: M48 family metalloprotease [Candidatus Melainabacteria bacterium]|nr:M48 family metalloprotease [Candidatus Melainabacteria bacterium]